MKKYINRALFYAILALAGGVFYREFTKALQFKGQTQLSTLHTHFFVLGMLVFLLAALFAAATDVESRKPFRFFQPLYHIGMFLTTAMMLLRGILQALLIPLNRSADAAISGFAGLGHALLGAGLICFLLALRKAAWTGKAGSPAQQ